MTKRRAEQDGRGGERETHDYRSITDECAIAAACLTRARRAKRTQSTCFARLVLAIDPSGASTRAELWHLASLGGRAPMARVGDSRGADAAGARVDANRPATSLAKFVAGCTSGAVSRAATNPLEVVRLRRMTGSSKALTLRGIARDEGVLALFRGTKASVTRHAPAKGVCFLVFHAVKERLTRARERAEAAANATTDALVSGAAAGLTSLALLYPLDSLLVRQATTEGAAMVGLRKGIGGILRREGARGLYRGVVPAALAVVPEAAITFGTYDLMRDWYASNILPPGERAGPVPSLFIGMASAAAGQAVAFPLDVVSRRMVIEGGTLGRTIRTLAKTSGARGFYNGLGATTLKILPMSSLTFFTYECVLGWLETEPRDDESDARAMDGRSRRARARNRV